jgi:signal transduction histidine kinase/CheY-like chemotaxis protein
LVLPINVCIVWLLAQHASRRRELVDALMALTYAVLALSVLLDSLLLFGLWRSIGFYTLPYTMPVLMAVFSLVLLGRVLQAMRDSEELTQTLERRVSERTLALQAAHDAKARFLTAASHDLRQPLHAIALLVGLLRERIRYPEVRNLVDRVQSGVDDLATLLGGLLDLSRLEGGQLQPRFEPVPLQPLLQSLAETAAPLAQARGLELRVARSRAVVRTDRVLLDSMLRNLVSNAIRYTPAGVVLVGVRRRPGAIAQMQVIDTGVGIAESDRQRVFDEFYRGRSAAQIDAGFGLGLSIVRRAADLLGHKVGLWSSPGTGTRISLDLPVVPFISPVEDGPAETTSADVSPIDRRTLAGTFVAVLEDDVAVRDALSALLRQWDCHVVVADSVTGLLGALKLHLRAPDLLLSDFRLGGGDDGLNAVAQLRARLGQPGSPALLLTADTSVDLLQRAGALGIPVSHKPILPAQLAASMALLIRGRSTSGVESEAEPAYRNDRLGPGGDVEGPQHR